MVKLTARQRMDLERELARMKSEASIEVLRGGYTPAINAGRDVFVKRESEMTAKETEKNYLDAIPEVDRREHRRL